MNILSRGVHSALKGGGTQFSKIDHGRAVWWSCITVFRGIRLRELQTSDLRSAFSTGKCSHKLGPLDFCESVTGVI